MAAQVPTPTNQKNEVDFAGRLNRAYTEQPMTLIDEARAELARREFRSFVPHAWPVIEKRQQFKPGWHIDCIGDHLQAVAEGQIKRLLINIPPRHMKSTLTTVMFPAWLWLQNPGMKIMNASYAQQLAVRDCVKSRRIITSERYRRMKRPFDEEGNQCSIEDGGKLWELSHDENLKSRYSNNTTGERNATSVDGGVTGEGGDIVIVDDPHNVKTITANSLRSTKEWWTDAMPTRLNNPETGVFIVIMQRVHENDLSGVILRGDDEYVHLCLPARHEGKSRMVTFLDGWNDPRKRKGEPLWKQHYGDKALKNLEKTMTAYARAGQLQQRPAPKEGGIFKECDFQLINSYSRDDIVRSVRYWDKAGTEDDGSWTVGVLIHAMKDGTFIIADVVRGQWSYAKRERRMKQTCLADYDLYCNGVRSRYEIRFEQEPGSGGKDSAARTRDYLLYDGKGEKLHFSKLKGARITIDKVTGSKETRAEPYAVCVENHVILVMKKTWTKEYIDEHIAFPNDAHDDQVDASSGGLIALTNKRKKAGGW